MDKVFFTSSSDPNVSVSLNKDTRNHLQRHFNSDMSGSKFIFVSPDQLLQTIVDEYPDTIRMASFNEYGCKVVSIFFPYDIGYCNVISLNDVTENEMSTLHIIQRGEINARCIKSDRIIPTKECQLILDKDNNVITAYPGELAPPLPESPDVHDEYWDNHVFIEPISE